MADAPPPQPLGTDITGPPAQAITHVVVSAQRPDPLIGHDTVAAVLGALVGGFLTAAVQFWSSSQQEKSRIAERDKSRRELDAAAAFLIINKANRAFTTIQQIATSLEQGAAQAQTLSAPPSSVILPSASDDALISFTDGELGLIQRSCKGPLMSRTLDLPHVQRMYIDFMRTYREMRGRLPLLVDENVISEEGVSTSTFKGKNAVQAEILHLEMNTLLQTMICWSPFDAASSSNTLHDLYNLFREKIGEENLHVRMDIVRREEPPDPRGREVD